MRSFLRRALAPLVIAGLAAVAVPASLASTGSSTCPATAVPAHSTEVACAWLVPGDLADLVDIRGLHSYSKYRVRMRNLNNNGYYNLNTLAGMADFTGTQWSHVEAFPPNAYWSLGEGRWQWLVTNDSDNPDVYAIAWVEQ